MTRWKGQVLVLLLATAHLVAQYQDSVRFVFRPVFVEDSLRRDVVRAIPRVELPRSTLERIPATTVADAVQGMPGVFVRNYGGLGGLKTVSIRGATAAQTAVVLDGIRLNTVSNGLVDLGQVPLALLERIAVERGSHSARWGAHAVGGAVLLSLRQYAPGVRAHAAIGAFGERSASLDIPSKIANHTISFLADVQYSQGNYPFTLEEFGSIRRVERTNSDALMANAALLWQATSTSLSSRVALFARSSQRGAPGAVLQGAIENAAARLDDSEVLVLGVLTPNAAPWTLRVSGRWFQQHYRDSLAWYRGPRGADDRFTAYDGAMVLELPRLTGTNWYVAPFSELYVNTLRGNLYRSGAGSYAQRLQFGAAVEAGTTIVTDTTSMFSIESTLRADTYSDVADACSGTVQARWMRAHLPIALRMSVGTSYRPPSFNELYYQNFGSTSLQPERGYTLSGGIIADVGMLHLEADGFVLWVRDQIIAVPRSAITWSVQNAGRVLSRGVEVLARYDDRVWRFQLSGTIQRTTYDDPTSFTYGKQVIYTPLIIGMVQIERMLWQKTTAFVQVNHIGTRYSQTDNAPTSALRAVTTVDISLRAILLDGEVRVQASGDMLNLFDAEYAIIRNYPMPGRMWRFGLTVQFD